MKTLTSLDCHNNDHPLHTIIDGISNNDYHLHPAISSSNCKDLLQNAWAFEYKRNNPKEPSTAMMFGSMVHHLLLEPYTFDEHCFVADKPKRTSNKGKAEYAKLEAEAGSINDKYNNSLT